jgi:hypothetical protein
MILGKKRYLSLLIIVIFILFSPVNNPFGRKVSFSGLNMLMQDRGLTQDSASAKRKKSYRLSEPDTNFTYEKYAAFLSRISDTSKYIVLPLNEFRKTIDSSKIVIGLRHDIDVDLDLAYKFSATESNLGIRSTYFILHTAPYYLANSGNMAKHSERIIPILKSMQNDRHFEIGWHNDLVTLQVVYNIDPVSFLHKELAWLRSNGINIYGTASHGSNYCYNFKYLNYYFFDEFTSKVAGQFVNNISIPVGGKYVPMIKGKLSDFNLEYEAYFINNNKYFSDAALINGKRWNVGMLNLDQLRAGDRVIILLHPVHWHKASVKANIEAFSIKGQFSSMVDTVNSTVTVEMPAGTDINSLAAEFLLSPGAYAKVLNSLQVSGSTLNNFNVPVIFTVYAENRSVRKEWKIRMINPKQ